MRRSLRSVVSRTPFARSASSSSSCRIAHARSSVNRAGCSDMLSHPVHFNTQMLYRPSSASERNASKSPEGLNCGSVSCGTPRRIGCAVWEPGARQYRSPASCMSARMFSHRSKNRLADHVKYDLARGRVHVNVRPGRLCYLVLELARVREVGGNVPWRGLTERPYIVLELVRWVCSGMQS